MTDSSGRYRVVRSLGKSGMGEVFLAEDTLLDRHVALKFLPAELQHDRAARERFDREARAAAALDHPYICKIYEITTLNDRPCIVMEYVAGETLQARMSRGRLAPKDALEIAEEIAEAMQEAHRRHILHRDLKPSNIILTEQGHVKVRTSACDRARARTLLGEAIEMYQRIGMPKHLEMVERMVAALQK